MLDYASTMTRLEDMRARFDTGFSSSDREFLTSLHQMMFGKIITLTGCSDCYRDAYLLIYNKLKRDGKMPKQTNYRLRPGAVIHEFGSSEYHALDVKDEVAEKYLAADETRIKLFERYPDDWRKRIKNDKPSDSAKTAEPVKDSAVIDFDAVSAEIKNAKNAAAADKSEDADGNTKTAKKTVRNK